SVSPAQLDEFRAGHIGEELLQDGQPHVRSHHPEHRQDVGSQLAIGVSGGSAPSVKLHPVLLPPSSPPARRLGLHPELAGNSPKARTAPSHPSKCRQRRHAYGALGTSLLPLGGQPAADRSVVTCLYDHRLKDHLNASHVPTPPPGCATSCGAARRQLQ